MTLAIDLALRIKKHSVSQTIPGGFWQSDNHSIPRDFDNQSVRPYHGILTIRQSDHTTGFWQSVNHSIPVDFDVGLYTREKSFSFIQSNEYESIWTFRWNETAYENVISSFLWHALITTDKHPLRILFKETAIIVTAQTKSPKSGISFPLSSDLVTLVYLFWYRGLQTNLINISPYVRSGLHFISVGRGITVVP